MKRVLWLGRIIYSAVGSGYLFLYPPITHLQLASDGFSLSGLWRGGLWLLGEMQGGKYELYFGLWLWRLTRESFWLGRHSLWIFLVEMKWKQTSLELDVQCFLFLFVLVGMRLSSRNQCLCLYIFRVIMHFSSRNQCGLFCPVPTHLTPPPTCLHFMIHSSLKFLYNGK